MKGSVLAVSTLVPAVLCASACAAVPRPPAMPEWSAPEAALVAASAPRDIDDDRMRVPRSEESEDVWQAQGLYIGGEIITLQPLGDFDDDATFQSPTNGDFITVPELDVGAGGGAYLSYRWRMNELVLQASLTEHDGESSIGDLDTTIYSLDLNWRHYFWEKSPLQPFALLGVGMSRAEIEDGSTDAGMTQTGDAILKDGININVGAGAALYTLPWVMFYGQAIYRFNRFTSAEGVDSDLTFDGDLDGDSFILSAGAAIRLLPSRR